MGTSQKRAQQPRWALFLLNISVGSNGYAGARRPLLFDDHHLTAATFTIVSRATVALDDSDLSFGTDGRPAVTLLYDNGRRRTLSLGRRSEWKDETESDGCGGCKE
jgi:hypothetical protein